MGTKKPSIRTLPTGEKAIHNPDGSVHLMPTNTLAARLHGQQEELEASHAELTAQMRANITARQEAMSGGKQPVPADKRSC